MEVQEQTEMQGMETPRNKKVDRLASELEDIRAQRAILADKESKVLDRIEKQMKDDGLEEYIWKTDRFDEKDKPIWFTVKLDTTPRVQLHRFKPKKENAEP